LRIKIGAFGGLVLASPIIFWQFWRFITPGLRSAEKRYAVPFVAASIALFLAGCALAYYIFPHALEFLKAIAAPSCARSTTPTSTWASSCS